MPTDPEPPLPERRRFRRYPVTLDLRYRLTSGVTGAGLVANMSSGGLLFHASTALPVGELIEADVAWPLRLNQVQALQVRVRGMIVRSSPAGTAISISRYEFRTYT